MTKATGIDEKGDFAGAVSMFDQAMTQFPANAVLWDSKGKIIERP